MIIYLLSGLIIFVSFAGVVYGSDYSSNLKENSWSESSCGQTSISIDDAYVDFLRDSAERQGLFQCFCYEQLTTNSVNIDKITFQNGENACSAWLIEYTTSQSILYGISAAVSFITAFMKIFIKLTSKYEAHHTHTERLRSTTTKMWVV